MLQVKAVLGTVLNQELCVELRVAFELTVGCVHGGCAELAS